MTVNKRAPLCGEALVELKFEPIDTVPFMPYRMTLDFHELVKIRVPNGSNNDGDKQSDSLRCVFIPLMDMGYGDDVPTVSLLKWLRQYITNEFPTAQNVHISSSCSDNKTFRKFVDFFPSFPFVNFIVRYEIDSEPHYRFYNLENIVINDDENNTEWFVLDLEHLPNVDLDGYLDE